MHVILFFICLFILVVRKKAAQLVILGAITIMFALATADTGLSFRFALHDLPLYHRQEINGQTILKDILPKAPLFVTNKYVSKSVNIVQGCTHWSP